MIKLFFPAFILLLLFSLHASAQAPIRYYIALDNIQHHELFINVEFDELEAKPLVVRMPNSSPGRYAEHNFAKNVYAVKAYDKAGNPLQVRRTKPSEWEVKGHNGYVKFAYTLYGNYADGTYTGIDSRKVHMNMPATFVYGVGMQQRPIELRLDLKSVPGWQVATQLKQLSPTTYLAPNYYYFYDSPTMIGNIDFRRWNSGNDTIVIAMQHLGTAAELDKYTAWVKQVVEAEKKVFGELPAFDYGKYTFLCSYNPWVHGDGMEHRNSTVCTAEASLAEADSALIGTVSHEFFHAWNVERLRPASLEPFDFDRANMSGALWFAEGFTSYYDDLILARAGIFTPEKFIKKQEGTFNYVLNSPGRLMHNPIQMSQTAPFVDAAAFGDEANFINTYVSYYPYGEVLAYALDLSLRSTFKDITLDDYMRYLWQHYGKPEKPYELEDLQQALAAVTGSKAFADEFFSQYIYKSELPDFKALFAKFGVEMKYKNPKGVQFGPVSFSYERGAVVQSQVMATTPFYQAGVEKGDIILAINGISFKSDEEFNALVKSLHVGKIYPIDYVQMGIKKSGAFIALPDRSWSLRYLPEKEIGKKTSKLRSSWLCGSAKK